MPERIAWWNGKMIPEAEARLSIYDSALQFGDMAFEMMRTFNKYTFKLWEHLERLFKSLSILEIDIPYTFDELYDAHENLIIHNRKCFAEDDEVRSLINVSRGTLPIYQEMLGGGEPNVIMAFFFLRDIFKGMANREVMRQDTEAWALLLDPDGYITEGTGSNFFIIKNNSFELITPEPRNCLRGITRDYVMKLARKLGIEVIEKNITLYDVYEAREAFFTCTPFCIMPCTRINGKPVGEGKIGKKTKYLMQKWSENEGVDFVEQVKRWDNVPNNHV